MTPKFFNPCDLHETPVVDMMRKMMVQAAVAWLVSRPDYSSSSSSWTRCTTRVKDLEEEDNELLEVDL